MPRLTTALNRGKRRVIAVADTPMMELAIGENLLEDIESALSRPSEQRQLDDISRSAV